MSVCTGCQRLWRKYADATMAHLQLDNELRQARARRDWDAIARLSVEVQIARRRLSLARVALREHEAAVHEQKAFGGLA